MTAVDATTSPSSAVAVLEPAGVTALALIKKTALAELVTLADGLGDLRTKYSNVAYAVATPAGMEDAKAARIAIRDPRYKVKHIVTAKKAELKQIGEEVEAFGAQFVADCMELETPIHEQIQAQERVEEEERVERKRVADELAAASQKAIDDMRSTLATAVGKPAADIALLLAQVEAVAISPELFGKRAGEAKQVQMQTVEALAALRDAAAAAEVQLAELAAFKAAEALRLKDEKDRADAEALATAAALDAQRLKDKEAADRLASEQRQATFAMEQITAVQALIGEATADGTVEGVSAFLATVRAWAPDETYGFLRDPALLARTTAVTQLEALLAKVTQEAIDAAAATAEADRLETEAQAARDQTAANERAERAAAEAKAAKERLAAKLAVQKAESVAAQLLSALRGMDAALEALTDGDNELACIPDGPEKTDLVASWDIARIAITAGT